MFKKLILMTVGYKKCNRKDLVKSFSVIPTYLSISIHLFIYLLSCLRQGLTIKPNVATNLLCISSLETLLLQLPKC
jgi:hypothetical protein